MPVRFEVDEKTVVYQNGANGAAAANGNGKPATGGVFILRQGFSQLYIQ